MDKDQIVSPWDEIVSHLAQQMSDGINREIIEYVKFKTKYLEETFGGLSEEQILSVLKKHYPENFI